MNHREINIYLASILNSRHLNEIILIMRTFQYQPVIKGMHAAKNSRGVFYLRDHDRQWINHWAYLEITGGIFITETEKLKQELEHQVDTSRINVWWFEELKQKSSLLKFARHLSRIDGPEVPVTATIYFTMDIEPGEMRQVSRWIDYLETHEKSWTFFICGEVMDSWEKGAYPWVQRLKNFPVGNHNDSHRELSRETIQRAHSLIKNQCRREPVGFRAPNLGINKKILTLLPSLHYKYDSSTIGFTPLRVVVGGKEIPLVEIPLLDGGDYVFFKKLKWDRKQYLDHFRKKIRYHYLMGNSFAILFHNQYSGFEIWKEALAISMDTGYRLGMMDHGVSTG